MESLYGERFAEALCNQIMQLDEELDEQLDKQKFKVEIQKLLE